jgi:hypothetical protein
VPTIGSAVGVFFFYIIFLNEDNKRNLEKEKIFRDINALINLKKNLLKGKIMLDVIDVTESQIMTILKAN